MSKEIIIDKYKRVNYFDNQFLKADEFIDEQHYHIEKRLMLTEQVYSPGVIDGFKVQKSGPTEVSIGPGIAIDAQGHAIVLTDSETKYSLNTTDPSVYLTISYSTYQRRRRAIRIMSSTLMESRRARLIG